MSYLDIVYIPYFAALDLDGSLANTGLMLNSANQTTTTNGTYNFSALNGTSPYTYTIISGGGSINTSTGAFTAPVTAGTTIIQVTDYSGLTAQAAIMTSEILSLTPITSSRTVNQAFGLTTTGGLAPYYYQIISGGGYIDSTDYFIAPSYPCTAVIRVTDLFGMISDATITITP